MKPISQNSSKRNIKADFWINIAQKINYKDCELSVSRPVICFRVDNATTHPLLLPKAGIFSYPDSPLGKNMPRCSHPYIHRGFFFPSLKTVSFGFLVFRSSCGGDIKLTSTYPSTYQSSRSDDKLQ